MKTPKSTSKKPAPKAKAEQTVPTIAKPVTAKKVAPEKKPVSAKKPAKKVQAVAAKPVEVVPELSMTDRMGLTAGSIWHYLSENGDSQVAKLLRELPEEDKMIQRSIGWLAQEGKITLETVNRAEIISLK